MSDPVTDKQQPSAITNTQQAASAPQSSGSSFGGIGLGAIISGLMGVLGAAAGASWPGVVALLLLGLTIPFGWSFLAKQFNDWSDKKDLERAGSDAGKTSVDLADQGRAVSSGLDAAQKLNPPTEGFPKS